MKFRQSLTLIISVTVAFIVGFTVAVLLLPGSIATNKLPAEFNALGETWQRLQESYVNQSALNAEKLSQGAIQGMMDALNDPYSAYFDNYSTASNEFEGSFEGIGATVALENGSVTIVAPIAGSPAEKAGIKAGDIILEIDGNTTQGLSVEDAVAKIRGPKGTSVTLFIQHKGDNTSVEMTIVRDAITIPSVSSKALTSEIAYIQINQFASNTTNEFRTALAAALDNGSKGIVLDLRDNPGGYLDVVADIADEFLDSGVILYEATDKLVILKEWDAKAGGLAIDIPLVVLVNKGSASGSEVLSGALQDHQRALIVGTTTYGKGSVDNLFELGDGSAIYLTTERWLTPDKHAIEGKGITPDYVIALTDDDIAAGKDPQLDYAIQYLQSEIK
jgi:carboxyl-terminal processing protease